MRWIGTWRAAAPAAALAAVVALAGCGSSSSSSSSTSAAASSQTQTAGQSSGRRGRLAACLRQQGVTLPQRPGVGQDRGAGGGGGGFLFGGGGGGGGLRATQDPKLRAALQKCGFRGGQRRNSAAFKATLAKFTACVRSNGYNLPNPNTSGGGPVFDPSKVNRTDPKFLTAVAKCQSLLRFRRGFGGPGGPGAGPPPGTGGA